MSREGVPGSQVSTGEPRSTSESSSDRGAHERRSQLLELVGRFRVRELARVAGISVEALAGRVLRAMGGGALVLLEAPATRARRPAEPGREVAEPALADLPGRATFAEVEAIVDRWVLGRVLGEHGGNVTRAAARLGTGRRVVRTRWAKVRALPATRSGLVDAAGEAVVPASPSLGEMLERGASLAEIQATVARWLIEGTLARFGGNVTRSAAVLGTSRSSLRWRRRGLESRRSRDDQRRAHDAR